MNNEKNDFISPGDPMIIFRKFNKKFIEEIMHIG
jgi:hypothetical protein